MHKVIAYEERASPNNIQTTPPGKNGDDCGRASSEYASDFRQRDRRFGDGARGKIISKTEYIGKNGVIKCSKIGVDGPLAHHQALGADLRNRIVEPTRKDRGRYP